MSVKDMEAILKFINEQIIDARKREREHDQNAMKLAAIESETEAFGIASGKGSEVRQTLKILQELAILVKRESIGK